MHPKWLGGKPSYSNVQENKALISQLLSQITHMKTTVKISLARKSLEMAELWLENEFHCKFGAMHLNIIVTWVLWLFRNDKKQRKK